MSEGQDGNQPSNDDAQARTLPADGSYVPRERLNEVSAHNSRLSAENERLSAELKSRAAGGSDQVDSGAQQEYTAEQIQASVDNGSITSEQGQTIWANQVKRLAAKTAQETAAETIVSTQRTAQLDAEAQRYVAAVPALSDNSSPEWQRLSKEYAKHVSLGAPDNEVTKIQALRSAFGDIEAVERAGSGGDARETHQETGGSADTGGSASSDGWAKDMPQKNRDYYQHLINTGVYADKKACNEEWNYKPKHNPRRTKAA